MKVTMKKLLINLLSLWSGIMLASLPSDHNRTNVIDELRVQKKQLGKNNPFNLFDLHLSQAEHDILESLHVKNSAPFDIYGRPEGKESDMNSYLESLGNNPEHARLATAIIYRFIKESLIAYGSPAAWITIRSSKQNSHFDIPRWHTDGSFFPHQDDEQAKILTTLKGPGTLLCNVSDETRKEYGTIRQQAFRELNVNNTMKNATKKQLDEHDHKVRPQLVALLAPYEIQQAQTRQGVIFLVGNSATTAAFHSEPAINTDRLFISILPGTDEQIKFLYDVRQAGRPL
jgi:hypothetical protein